MTRTTCSAVCPICGKKFKCGYYHPANQKVYDHMMSKGKGHKRRARAMDWDMHGWVWGPVVMHYK
jgi:hypothetical protein